MFAQSSFAAPLSLALCELKIKLKLTRKARTKRENACKFENQFLCSPHFSAFPIGYFYLYAAQMFKRG